MQQIDSNYIIEDVDQTFKVTAGPGAGKTYWLINHVKNVLHKSNRLGKIRKIACITYTNVAVNEILSRIGDCADRVEVSTIHSFLYKNVVKPYLYLIADEYEFNVNKMDGHDDEIIYNYPFIHRILEDEKCLWYDFEYVINAIGKFFWHFGNDGNLVIKPSYPHLAKKNMKKPFHIKNQLYLRYKKECWKLGKMHHDDVLFFSYQLINRYPFILQILAAKFPYFYVDEFQDSNPIQVKILKQIGQYVIVGVIGDQAQSIYNFQGIKYNQLEDFQLPNMEIYQMIGNRRSFPELVNLLNSVRLDLFQECISGNPNGNLYLLVGASVDTYRKTCEIIRGYNIVTLSRDNISANAMKRMVNVLSVHPNILSEFYVSDSDPKRVRCTVNIIKAIDLALQKRYKESIQIVSKIVKGENPNAKAVIVLKKILLEYPNYKNGVLLDYNRVLANHLRISEVKRGKVYEFYNNHTYLDLSIAVNNPEDYCMFRTVHKAKGAEFDNVLYLLDSESNLNFLLCPDLSDEEQRISYVAISRARQGLFISVPELSEVNETKLRERFPFLKIERV